MHAADPSPPLQITAVPLGTAAALLSKAGPNPINLEVLTATIAQGAPQNPDGTLNLIHYAAWLVREIAVDH